MDTGFIYIYYIYIGHHSFQTKFIFLTTLGLWGWSIDAYSHLFSKDLSSILAIYFTCLVYEAKLYVDWFVWFNGMVSYQYYSVASLECTPHSSFEIVKGQQLKLRRICSSLELFGSNKYMSGFSFLPWFSFMGKIEINFTGGLRFLRTILIG